MSKLLADAEAGQPVVLLVSGDAGVGKTRLLTELAAGAARQGFTVLSGRCAELADSVPYLPLADALRAASSGPLAEAVATRPVLARLLPDREITRQPGDLPGVAQQQLFGAVLGMLAELAAAQPGLAHTGGPALGGPLHQGPGHVPEPGAPQGAARPGGELPHG